MKKYYYTVLLLVVCLNTACTKDFLDEKPNKELVVPATLDDLQAMLDNTSQLNQSFPATQEVATDNYYLTDQNYNAVAGLVTKNAYIWAPNVFNDSEQNDWALSYITVFNTNIVLETLEKIKPTAMETERWNNIRGTALFYRALAFHYLAELFAKPYDGSTASADLGIPLRLASDINAKSTRASLQQTYEQILSDLNTAAALLPETVRFKTRPNSLAAKALLARVYLSMENYPLAGQMANDCLMKYSTLIDYNTLSKTSIRPLAQFNDEVIFHYTLFGQPISLARIDPALYGLYNSNDLRKTIFFRLASGTTLYTFKGSYNGGSAMFGGLTTDELYLIRAECLARSGKIREAMDDLNTLMRMRWNKNVTFPLFTAGNEDEALTKILTERRKELIFRGLRWSDLRRLNRHDRFKTTLKRTLDGKDIELQPNSNAYVFQIPESVIRNNGMQQNPR